MSKKVWIGIIVLLVVIGGIQKACQPEWYDARMNHAEDAMVDLETDITDAPPVLTREYLEGISKETFAYSKSVKAVNEIKPSEISKKARERLGEVKEEIAGFQKKLDMSLLNRPAAIINTSGSLLDSIATIPVWLEQGETLNYSVRSDKPLDVTLYNYDSRNAIVTYKATQNVSQSYRVPYSAIYLLRLEPKERQYASVDISYRPNSLDRLMRPAQVAITHENGSPGAFLSQQIDGIRMTDAFNEPQKVTLRSGLKSAFSGSTRSLIPVQITNGATDLLYNLQISNNEDKKNEKDFNKGMSTSYRKVRILGLPVYDSQSGSGLISTMLGLNTPIKEEESYANMYVFFNADQARKFQNGTPVSQLKYSLDYSVQGSQSRNGRIPVAGHKTVYLGFENERMRYSTYIWLSGILSKPAKEYVITTYKVELPSESTKFVKDLFYETDK